MPHSFHAWAYIGLLVAVACYALRYGGWPERTVAIVHVAASTLSHAVTLASDEAWQRPMLGTLAIDATVCLSFLWVTLRSDRFWTIWNLGLAFAEVSAHVARLATPTLPPLAYQLSEAKWAYPMLLLLAIGTYGHARRRRADPAAATPTPSSSRRFSGR